jgi:hypothetical protein
MKIPCFYYYLQFKLAEHSKSGNIHLDSVYSLFKQYRIPKKLKPMILDELEGFGLISCLDNGIIKVLRKDFDEIMEKGVETRKLRVLEMIKNGIF